MKSIKLIICTLLLFISVNYNAQETKAMQEAFAKSFIAEDQGDYKMLYKQYRQFIQINRIWLIYELVG